MQLLYLTVSEVLAMHADQVDRYGGIRGIRDPGLLEAALFRPQTGYYADLIEEVAALWESLSQNHPFVDGYKRTAFAAVYTFLAINRTRLNADAEETYDFVARLYEKISSGLTGSFPGYASMSSRPLSAAIELRRARPNRSNGVENASDSDDFAFLGAQGRFS